MGTYDTFEFECKKCGYDENYPQTKLFRCEMDTYSIGNPLKFNNMKDFVLELKDGCWKCKSKLFVLVEKGKITDVVNDATPNIVEQAWGDYEIKEV